MTTLKDIAIKANVSISTVSKVLNSSDSTSIGEDTKMRITNIAMEEGYFPNRNAKTLSNMKNNKVISCILSYESESLNNTFFNKILEGVHNEIEHQGYTLGYTLSSSDSLIEIMEENIEANDINSAIILGKFSPKFLKFVKNSIQNLVYAGLNSPNIGCDEVVCDAYKAVKCAVEHLIELGNEKIAYIGIIKDKRIANECRFEAFENTLKSNGLKLHKDFVRKIALTTEQGYAAMMDMLKVEEIPTAVFCGNDVTAIGVVRAAEEKGIRIPDELSIISIDDIDMARYVKPSLTTIHVPKEELGKFAVKLLVDKIETERLMPVKVELPFELVIRESCK